MFVIANSLIFFVLTAFIVLFIYISVFVDFVNFWVNKIKTKIDLIICFVSRSIYIASLYAITGCWRGCGSEFPLQIWNPLRIFCDYLFQVSNDQILTQTQLPNVSSWTESLLFESHWSLKSTLHFWARVIQFCVLNMCLICV